MTLAARIAATVLALTVGGCALLPESIDDPQLGGRCGEEPTRARAECLASNFEAGELVAEVRAPGAAAFLFLPLERPDLAEDVIVVFMMDDGSAETGYRRGLLSADQPAMAERIGAAATTVNGDRTEYPGYLIGVVRDERIVAIELAWPAGDVEFDPELDFAAGTWTTSVIKGLFLIPVPARVPLRAEATYRFLDDAGDAVFESDGP